MALTPKDFVDISEDIESIYQRTVDELLINIATHFNINGWERTRYWEIKKLAEVGALTEESAKIIAQNTGRTEEEIREAFLQVSEKACMDIDPELKAAAEQGILQDPGTTPSTSVLMRTMVQAFVDQAVDKLNMTNQTMLESTRQAYLRGVTSVANEMQLEEAKLVLEAQSLEVTLGQETFPRAVRKAMNQLAASGITGFVDTRGRTWQPEGYAAMVIRSTSHNAAVQSIKTRQAEFGGGDVFQISSHTGARPLCAPYQGGVYSWGNSSGVIHDGDGKEIHYEPIGSTSYGQAAGIFGINCGHHPIPLVDGYSYLQEGTGQTPEENAKEYKESQQQRALERNVRKAKRELEMAIATGDKVGEEEAKKRVREAQKIIKAYVDKTGRVRRYDREQVGAAPPAATPPTPPTTPKPRPKPAPTPAPASASKTPKTTTTTSKTPPTTPPKTPKSLEAQDVAAILKIQGVARIPFKMRKKIPDTAALAEEIGGLDKTNGACTSLALCWAAARHGANIRDFRGDYGTSWFSQDPSIRMLASIPGIDCEIKVSRDSLGVAQRFLKTMQPDKEYILSVARHTAVVRHNSATDQDEYLELQGIRQVNKFWPLTERVLRNRFGASENQPRECDNFFFDLDSVGSNSDMMILMEYINTKPEDQMKGAGGGIK